MCICVVKVYCYKPGTAFRCSSRWPVRDFGPIPPLCEFPTLQHPLCLCRMQLTSASHSLDMHGTCACQVKSVPRTSSPDVSPVSCPAQVKVNFKVAGAKAGALHLSIKVRSQRHCRAVDAHQYQGYPCMYAVAYHAHRSAGAPSTGHLCNSDQCLVLKTCWCCVPDRVRDHRQGHGLRQPEPLPKQ